MDLSFDNKEERSNGDEIGDENDEDGDEIGDNNYVDQPYHVHLSPNGLLVIIKISIETCHPILNIAAGTLQSGTDDPILNNVAGMLQSGEDGKFARNYLPMGENILPVVSSDGDSKVVALFGGLCSMDHVQQTDHLTKTILCKSNTNIVFPNANQSRIKLTESDRLILLTTEFCSAGRNYDWSNSANNEHSEDMPTYTMHDLNKEFFHRGESRLCYSADAEEIQDKSVRDRFLLIYIVKEKRKFLPISNTLMVHCHILIINECAEQFILPLVRIIE